MFYISVTNMPTEIMRDSRNFPENSDIHLPYELSYIPDDLRKRAKSELFEDEDTRVHSLRLLKSMLRGETA